MKGYRFLSSTATLAAKQVPELLPRNPLLRTHLIFGANTDVGKTVLSAGLVKASLQANESPVHYIKPLQCGGCDEAFVANHCLPSRNLHCSTLFDWDTPASPHVSSRKENAPRSDEEVLTKLKTRLQELMNSSSNNQTPTTCWLETAGGVLSPSSSSPQNSSPRHARNQAGWGWLTQGDLYQPFVNLAPVVLCGDGKLGGISATLSSLESLILRGYHVAGIVLLETGYDNGSALREYAGRYVPRTKTGVLYV
jgi:bifunctional dethiobiotin synthetase / adenosylmethionine---8-amino-7-oxononanoate aminotransferase